MAGIVYLTVLFAVAILILVAVDRVTAKNGRLSIDAAAQRNDFQRRASAPDWDLYAAYLKRPIPPALQSLFSPKYLSAKSLRFGEIDFFLSPIDVEALKNNWVVPGVLPFAYWEADPIYLKAGAEESDAVYITYHDGGETEKLSSSIESFAHDLRTDSETTVTG